MVKTDNKRAPFPFDQLKLPVEIPEQIEVKILNKIFKFNKVK